MLRLFDRVEPPGGLRSGGSSLGELEQCWSNRSALLFDGGWGFAGDKLRCAEKLLGCRSIDVNRDRGGLAEVASKAGLSASARLEQATREASQLVERLRREVMDRVRIRRQIR